MKRNILFVNLLSTPYDAILDSFSGSNLVIQEIVMPLGLMYLSSYLKRYNPVALGETGLVDYTIFAGRISEYASLDDFIAHIARDSRP